MRLCNKDALLTRNDVNFAYNFWARHQQNFDEDDYEGLKHTGKFLVDTAETKKVIRRGVFTKTEILQAYGDASWADDGTRRSTSGIIFVYCGNVI